MKSLKLHFLILLLVLPAVVSTAPVYSADGDKKAPDMTVYSGFAVSEAEVFTRAFSRLIGRDLNIEVEEVKTGKIVERLEKEGEKCKASVVFGGSLPAYLVAAKKGLFQSYHSPETKKYDKKFKDPKGFWTGIYVGMIGFAVDGNSRVPIPESWADLLKPVYTGKISIADPNYSGTSYITMSTLVQLMGEEEAFEYLKALDRQVAVYPQSGSEPAKMVARGAIAVGISFAHDILKAANKKPHVILSFPKEGTGIEIGGAAIPKHSPSPELARKFIDYLASESAQNLYGTSGIPPRFPTHPKAKRPAAAMTKGKLMKIFDFDFDLSASNEKRLKKRWTEEILEPRE